MSTAPDKAAGRFSIIADASQNAANEFLLEEENSSQFAVSGILGTRWNKLYPYQLIVVEKSGNSWTESSRRLKFTLPIPPQTLEIDMPFAINTSATLGGVVEEHNGAPFRMINFSGTTGVLPLKGAPDTVERFSIAQSIFAGTVNAAVGLANDIARSSIVPDNMPNVIEENFFSDSTDGNTSQQTNATTGYYQWHLLKKFFETYATLKKRDDGKNLRLAFAMWKDDSVYLVTPMMFKTSRSAQGPYEYMYQLSLKAWARIKLDSDFIPDSHPPLERDPSKLAKVIAAMELARITLEGGRNILKASLNDIESTLFRPMREVVFAAKSIAGVAISLADVSSSLILDSREAILSVRKELTALKDIPADILKQFRDLGSESEKATTGDGRLRSFSQPGLSVDNSLNSDDYRRIVASGAHPANRTFQNPEDYFLVFSKIDPANLKLPINIQRKLNEERDRAINFTRKDFEKRRDSVQQAMWDFAESVGLGSQTFNDIYSITPKNTASKEATEADYEVLHAMNSMVMELNRFCVSSRMDPDQTDAIEYIAGLARKSGIAFKEPRSKFLVPFLANHTLEEMAKIYLNDANRWHEIATLNGLREPYIDEVGFDIFLATNGKGNTVQVDSVTNLFVGQFVWISSSTERPEKRRITGINKITDGIYFINLSGDGDLDRFTVVAQSKMHAYLPDTVNSQMSIYIPSQDDPQLEDFLLKPIPGIDYFDNLTRVGGVSLLLNAKNDIMFTPDGRSRLAVGLNNIVQKTRIALSTPKRALLQHPSYGLPVKIGDSTADVSAKDVLKSIRDMFSKDPSFSSITSASVSKIAGAVRITVNVGIKGSEQIFPITAEVRR